MNTLDTVREGQRTRDRLQRMLRNDATISRDQLIRMVEKMGAGLDVIMPPGQAERGAMPAGVGRGFAAIVHEGGRS